jgi:tRNA(Met) cytidine acetyltransferase
VLGVAAARLLGEGLPRITVVAPHRAAAATLFAQAQAAAGLPLQGVADMRIGTGTLRFRLPAECLADGDAPGLVLVDEAAAIPVAVLGRLLDRANRLVFASTVHGYEGSGRGFELRFQQELARRMPQWRTLQLTAPVRWAADDPLEALVNDAFLLDAELDETGPDEARPGPAARADLAIAEVEPARLQRDEGLLRSVFGLLVNAHYQTRPSDLRQLLDNPDNRLWVARRGGAVVGVLLASLEGGLDAAMAGRVLSGQRRPRGHLLPQSLAVHAGLEACLQQRVARVQRIAVHPRLQRRGIASRLLQGLAAWAAGQGFDLLGCAFGAEPSLLAFWRANGFVPVRLGVRVDPASAAHSLFMLRGLSARGGSLAAGGARRFLADLPWSLAAGLRDLESRLAAALLRGRDCRDLELDEADRLALRRIADGVRPPATADAVVWKALVHIAAHGAPDSDRLAPLVAAHLQHRNATQLCEAFAVCGRRELDGRLRALLRDREQTLGCPG